ncbi:MAG: type II toxin-antitoxin system RelE/ParE family toxin, partial [Betaproteobacteria bacterium]|nr:type II toxin-antitoxin system RelE/ParE family toxin [Betaproteobacteria bacterium]
MSGTPAKFEVLLTDGAEQDLEAIHDYISEFDCVANANHVLDELMEVVKSLSRFPERGSYPKELVSLGIKEYRQTFFKPYRVVYRVTGSQVIIYLIA